MHATLHCPAARATPAPFGLLLLSAGIGGAALLSSCRRADPPAARRAHVEPSARTVRLAPEPRTGGPAPQAWGALPQAGPPGGASAPRPRAPEARASSRPGPAARGTSRPAPPDPSAPKVYGKRRLRLGPPPPIVLVTAGAAPRVRLRYRAPQGTTFRWRVDTRQQTRVRAEKQCPTRGARGPRKRPRRTLLAGYRLTLQSQVTLARPGLLELSTRFSDVSLQLPPSLEDRRKLLTRLVEQGGYRIRLTPTGAVRLFELGALAPKELSDLLGEMRTPLGAGQPVFPEAPVGVGATWRQRVVLPYRPVSGDYQARFETEYRLTRLSPSGTPRTAHLSVWTRIAVQGKLMGKPLAGSGESRARLEIDLATGLLRAAQGETDVCTSVLEQTSTNHTTFSQRMLPAGATPPPAPRRAAAATAPVPPPGPRAPARWTPPRRATEPARRAPAAPAPRSP